VAQEIPPTTINGPATGDLLVVGWGGTYGSITAAVRAGAGRRQVGRVDPSAAPESVAARPRSHTAGIPEGPRAEINSGQLVRVLRAEYLVDAVGFNRVRGLPLASEEILEAIHQLLGSHA